MFSASVAGILIYGYLLITPYWTFVLQITAFVGIAAILGILAWIGWTMATTPPPTPMEAEVPPVSTVAAQSQTEAGMEKQDK